MRHIKTVSMFVVSAIFLGACTGALDTQTQQDQSGQSDKEKQSQIVTGDADELTYNSAVLHGSVMITESLPSDFKTGILMSDKEDIQLETATNLVATELQSDRTFSVKATELAAETKYYYKAYVYRNSLYVYGEVKNFTTKDKSITEMSMSKSSRILNPGDGYRLYVNITPKNSRYQGITWSTSDSTVATVSLNGYVWAAGLGSCVITATSDNGLTTTCKVNVKNVADGSHSYVNLGLSVKWASRNIGAENPEDYGNYYCWGETTTKDYFTESAYKWYGGSPEKVSKYNYDSTYGTVDNKSVLDPEDDIAHVRWGGDFRIPTRDEWQELVDKCTWRFTARNGVYGFLITGKGQYSGVSIFLPACGRRDYMNIDGGGGSTNMYGTKCCYLSSTLSTSKPYYFITYEFMSDKYTVSNCFRYSGFSVRAVTK